MSNFTYKVIRNGSLYYESPLLITTQESPHTYATEYTAEAIHNMLPTEVPEPENIRWAQMDENKYIYAGHHVVVHVILTSSNRHKKLNLEE